MRTFIYAGNPFDRQIDLSKTRSPVTARLQERLEDETSLVGKNIRNFEYVFEITNDVIENNVRILNVTHVGFARRQLENWDLHF